MKHAITLYVNGQEHHLQVESHHTLLDVLRRQLGLTGTKHGCDCGECGACSIWLNDRLVLSCLILAAEADGAQVVTVEGLAAGGEFAHLQEAFIEHHGMQCGFCTAGFLMAAAALLRENARPDTATIRAGLAGNLCRCTGYHGILRAVQTASRMRR